MKEIFVNMKGYIKECILSPLFKLFEVVLELLVPLVVASIIDVGIKNGDKPYIIKMCIVLAVFGIVGFGVATLAQYYAAKASSGFISKLKAAFFAHLQSLSFTELDEIGISTMITNMTNSMNQIHTGVNLTLRLLLRSPIVVFGALIMAFTIDTKTAIIFAITIPILAVVVFGVMLVSLPLYKKVQETVGKLLSKTRENLYGVRVIRAFCREEKEVALFEQENQQLLKRQKFVGKISALLNPLTFVIVNIAIVVLIYSGAWQVQIGNLSQGAVIALCNLFSQILVELIKFAALIITVTKSIAACKRVASVFEVKSSMILPKNAKNIDSDFKFMVEFKNASFTYKNASEPSLENVDFELEKGQTLGIIGGTGSGKSTLINLIPRFYDCTVGEVLVGGVNVKELDLENLRGKIGIVMQKSALFFGSIKDNLIMGDKSISQQTILKALESAQALNFVNEKEKGIDFIVEQGGRNLSGGQKQRLCIARALCKKPDILILDDSSSALDFATDAALRKAIREWDSKMSVVIVSQRTSSILCADLILVLDDGVVVGKGNHAQLLESCQTYKEIHESQFSLKEAN